MEPPNTIKLISEMAESIDEISMSTYPESEVEMENCEASNLPQFSIDLLQESSSDKISFQTVPPSTPASNFSFEDNFNEIPKQFPKFDDDVKLPYIRDVGIKSCIESLGGYFNCTDYRLDPIQFWFLDVITDCLWRTQDEFQFPERYQKIIVEWIIYVLDLIRAPHLNLSKKHFFRIFTEALVIAEEKVQSGCENLPSPSELFTMDEMAEEKQISFPSSTEASSTASSESSLSSGESFVAVEDEQSAEFFKLNKPACKCYEYLYSSSSESILDEHEDVGEELEESSIHSSDLSVAFYQPDPNTPPRFISSSSSSEWSEEVPPETGVENGIDEEDKNEGDSSISMTAAFTWQESSKSSDTVKKRCPSDIFDELLRSPPSRRLSKTSKGSKTNRSMKISISQSVNEIKNSGSSIKPSVKSYESVVLDEIKSRDIRRKWFKCLEGHGDVVKNTDKNILMNTCALVAIREFVYDYFYETFQFILVKLALLDKHNVISEKINDSWNVPKIIREVFKRPKPKKQKKPKKPKSPKKKKDKKSKKSKSKTSKKGKKGKKDKKPKKHKLTKEEKAELARLKREQERLEEERRKAEENRRLLFPLNNAVDEEFFKEIFENWVKPKEKKGNKGKGKKKK